MENLFSFSTILILIIIFLIAVIGKLKGWFNSQFDINQNPQLLDIYFRDKPTEQYLDSLKTFFIEKRGVNYNFKEINSEIFHYRGENEQNPTKPLPPLPPRPKGNHYLDGLPPNLLKSIKRADGVYELYNDKRK